MIAPGATLGLLGGGQLGRMIALAARRMGLRVVVMDPDPECAAKPVVDELIVADFDRVDAAERFAQAADVATIEIEKIAVSVLEEVHQRIPLRPGTAGLAMIRDRGKQKQWLELNGLPLGAWRLAESETELRAALVALPGRCFVKSCTGGYDGRGQSEVDAPDEAGRVWKELGAQPVVVEQAVDLDFECSIMVARRPNGEMRCYEPARNHHENRILAWSAWPGDVSEAIARQAESFAVKIADAMGLEGVLTIELFVTQDQRVLVNELAPRVHNSYHATERSAATSQFEQAVRAVCDWPLGSTTAHAHSAIVNLLGETYLKDGGPDWNSALSVETVTLHDYGKRGARTGRKMGHLSATGSEMGEAVSRVREAFARL